MFTDSCQVLTAATLPSDRFANTPLDPEQVRDGSPRVRTLEIAQDEAVAVGLWEHTAGASTDVESDEVFVVLSGRATIEVQDGPTLHVGPGDVGLLTAGARTVWTVHEDLRKVYVVRS